MDLVWNPWALPGILVGLLAMGLAWVVYITRPDRFQNRVLAVLLFVMGANSGGPDGIRFLLADPHDAYGMLLVRAIAFGGYFATAPLFYSTLSTPLSAPLRPRGVRAAIVAGAVLYTLFILARPSDLWARMERLSAFDVWVGKDAGPLWLPTVLVAIVVFLYGIPVALDALRRARGPLERRQMKAVAAAFVTLNALNGGLLATYALLFPRGDSVLESYFPYLNFGGPIAAVLLFVSLLSYGILKAQIFDIDVKIRWTVRQSTVAAAFIAVFFVVSEVAKDALSAEAGPVVGILAAGALVFALAPLQRAAERVAVAAVPAEGAPVAVGRGRPAAHGGPPTANRDAYRAAVEMALADGVVTRAEERSLAKLAQALGLGPEDALEVREEAERVRGLPEAA
ncbi:MAG: hypothetical protein ACT4PT_10830 [Methanobacteriota archaeon]